MERIIMSEHKGDGYWGPRSEWNYYKKVKYWLDEYSPLESFCDVGGWDTPVCTWGEFDRRVNVNLGEVHDRIEGIEYVIQDFMEYDPEEKFDIVSCLQVLEHLDDETVVPFTRKLLSQAKVATIITVPHMWPEDFEIYHKQDPISIGKLIGWAGRVPDRHEIIMDRGYGRIAALFLNK